MIKVTEVKIILKPDQEPLKAFASITFEDCFVIHDLRVIKVNEKMFVAMPSKKINQPNQMHSFYKDIAHPINKDMRDYIEATVLKEYEKTLQSM